MARRSTPPPALVTSWDRILALRLARQHLATRSTPDQAVDVVRDLVGIHAQVMGSAELQLATRVDGLRVTDVRDFLWEQRRLVKAWSFRGTLHLLVPDDLVDFVAAAPTRERWRESVWQRYFHMPLDDVEAIIAAVDAVLSDRPMTRAELADAVAERVGDAAVAERLRTGWGTFLGAPAQRGSLIFGPSDGRNVTFVKPSTWLARPIAPADRADAPEPIDAMASMIARFLAAFPGSSRDMIGRWWGATRGSLVRDAVARLPVDVAEIEIEIDGVRLLVRAQDVDALAATEPFVGVRLLPGFDPFTNELPRRVESILPVANHDLVYRTAGWVTPLVLVDGRIAGTWEIGGRSRGVVHVTPWGRWRGGVRDELTTEVDRFAAFLGRPLAIELRAPLRIGTGAASGR
jgi:hypothetical protein